MPGVPEKDAKAFNVAWKKAEEESTKKTEKEVMERATTCVLVENFTDPFYDMLSNVLSSCTSDHIQLGENEFPKLMKIRKKMLPLSYDFHAFALELHAILPSLKEHLKSKKKDKRALEYIQKWDDACLDEKSNLPKTFRQAQKAFLKGDFKELGFW